MLSRCFLYPAAEFFIRLQVKQPQFIPYHDRTSIQIIGLIAGKE